MRNLFTSLRAFGLVAAALALLISGHAAQAANPFELNFWLSGPRYDGRVAPCEARASDHHLAIPAKGKHLLEFGAGDHRLRPDPRNGLPALAVRQHPATILQRLT